MKIRKLLFLSLILILGILIFIPNNVKAAVGDTFTINNIAYRIIEENGSHNLVDVSQYHGNETNIIIPETVENDGKVFDVISIGYTYSLGIGYSNSVTSITIPKSVATIGSNAFLNCTKLEEIKVDEDNQNYCSVDGVLFSKDKTEILCYPDKKEGTTYQIPNSVTFMEDRTFFGLKNIPLTIYCNSGSYAEQYAKDNNINYKTTSIFSITTDLTNISSDGEFYTSPDMGDYTIILIANNGYKLPKNIIVKIDGIDLSLNDYKYDLKTGNLKIKADKINGNIEIGAIAEKMYRVSFDANGGNFSDGNNILTFEDAENCDFDNLNIPTRSSYKFIGYYTEKTGGTSIEDIINSEAGINKDITFYAQWKVVQEDITENNPENDNKDDNTENTPSDNNGANTENGNKEDNNNTNNTNKNNGETNSNNANTGNTNKPSGNNPQTGDNIVLYIIILLVSSMGIIFTTKIRKK